MLTPPFPPPPPSCPLRQLELQEELQRQLLIQRGVLNEMEFTLLASHEGDAATTVRGKVRGHSPV